jgi:hypothetical protein
MKTYGWSEGTVTRICNVSTLGILRFMPLGGKRPLNNHRTGGWTDLRGGMHALKTIRAKTLVPGRDRMRSRRPSQPIAHRYTTELPRRLSLMAATQSFGESSFPQLLSAKQASPRERYSSGTITVTHRMHTLRCQGIIHLLKKEILPGPGPTYRLRFRHQQACSLSLLLTCVWTASQEQLLGGMWSQVLTVQQSYLCNRPWMPIGI